MIMETRQNRIPRESKLTHRSTKSLDAWIQQKQRWYFEYNNYIEVVIDILIKKPLINRSSCLYERIDDLPILVHLDTKKTT